MFILALKLFSVYDYTKIFLMAVQRNVCIKNKTKNCHILCCERKILLILLYRQLYQEICLFLFVTRIFTCYLDNSLFHNMVMHLHIIDERY